MNDLAQSRVCLYWQPGCPRSIERRAPIQAWCARCGLVLDEIDVSLYPETLFKRFRERTPAVAVNGRARVWGDVSMRWVEREIVAAATAKQSSRLKVIRVSAVVVLRRGKMLINKRPEGTFYGGWWEWPGGKANAGETMEACALRELDEEIGIRVRDIKLFDRLTVEYPERLVDLSVFTAQAGWLARGRRGALEHRWLRADRIRALKFLEPNIPVLEKLIALDRA